MKLELFLEAYAILDGIPDHNIALDSFVDLTTSSPTGVATCGTIACGAGFLCLHPVMQAQGLFLDRGVPRLERNGVIATDYWALALFFDISHVESCNLFYPRDTKYVYDPSYPNSLTDKQLLLSRMRNFLQQQGYKLKEPLNEA